MFKESYLREGGIRTCFPCILEKKNTDKATFTNTKLQTDAEVKMQRSDITRHHTESVKPKLRFGFRSRGFCANKPITASQSDW